MKKSLAKNAPAWHAQVAAELVKDFGEVNTLEMTAAKRRAYLGLKFIWVKETGKADDSIPHGQFETWLEKFCPAIPLRTIRRYTNEAETISKGMGWQIGQFGRFDTPPHKLLELPIDQIPAKEQKAQQMLLDLVEGNGKFQRVTEYKQVDDDGKPARGNKSGKGCTRQMRLNATFKDEEETARALEVNVLQVANWLKTNCTEAGFPTLLKLPGGRDLLREFREAVTETHLFFVNRDKRGN